MPSLPVVGTLTNTSDTLTMPLGAGPGTAPDGAIVLGLSGTFAGAVLAVEGIMAGQPVSPSAWQAVELSAGGSGYVSPLTLSSTGQPGTGFAFVVQPPALYQQLRVRLVSIVSGSILASFAGVPALPNVARALPQSDLL